MTKTDQRTETEKDRAPSRKTEKLQQTNQTDNRSTQGPHPPLRSKRTLQSDNCRKGQRPSVGANWIPGGHLRFQRLSNSKPKQNAVESQAKNKKSLAKCLSGTGLCHAIRSFGKFQNSGATDPSNKLDISPSSASNCSLR